MASIDVFVKIEKLEDLKDIFSSIDLLECKATWKNCCPKTMSPITEHQFVVEQRLMFLSEKDKQKKKEEFLNSHHYKNFLQPQYDYNFLEIGDIVCSKGLIVEHPELLKNRLERYGKGADYTIPSNDKWIGLYGAGNTIAFKLLQHIAKKTTATFVIKLEDYELQEKTLFLIEEDCTHSVNLNLNSIFQLGLKPEYFELNALSQFEKKEIVLAYLINNRINDLEHIKEVEELSKNIYKQIEHDKISLIDEIADNVEKGWASVFNMSADEIRKLINSYIMYKEINNSVKHKQETAKNRKKL